MSEPGGPNRKTLRWAMLGVVGACVFAVAIWFTISEHATGKVMAGVQVAEIDLSHLSRDEARARILSWAEQRGAQKLSFSLDGSLVALEAKSAGFRVDADASVEHALAVGREGSVLGRFSGFVARWFRPESVPAEANFDAILLGQVLDGWQSTAIKNPPFAGGLSINGANVTPLYPHSGNVLDRARVTAQLKSAVLAGNSHEPLATRVETPKTDHAEVDRVLGLAQGMLHGDVELTTADGAHRLQFSPTDVAGLLQVKPGASEGRLEVSCALDATARLLEPRRAGLEQQPENARFVIDAQDRVHVEPGRNGFTLDATVIAPALCSAAQGADKKGELPLAAGAEPALSTEAAEHLEVVGLVSSFSTHHACCQPRVQNIHHIADLLDNTLVRPGETFSVNQLVGQRSLKNGFRLAPSIEDGEMVDTVGGGVSQFATTLFNALFYGGYDILERQPHTYWFTRYPEGYDATLSFPHPDIVFKNDTAAGALIKTSYTDTTITVKIYGDNGGRKVRAEVSARQNIVQPPLEYIPNPHLDADEEKTREGGMIGWSVIVKRTLTFSDGKIKEERRKVTYKPRTRRVEVHPCRIPEGEPGHTGERCPKPEKDDAPDAGP